MWFLIYAGFFRSSACWAGRFLAIRRPLALLAVRLLAGMLLYRRLLAIGRSLTLLAGTLLDCRLLIGRLLVIGRPLIAGW